MNQLLVWTLQKARQQTLNLVTDLPAEQMCLQTITGENHPLWILGHLLLSDTYLLHLLKVRELSAEFTDLLENYGPNSKPKSFIENCHSKSFLIEKLTETGNLRLDSVRQLKDLNEPMPDELLSQTQPTIGHHLQMLIFHEGHHCGQISMWRKMQGLSAVKGIFAS